MIGKSFLKFKELITLRSQHLKKANAKITTEIAVKETSITHCILEVLLKNGPIKLKKLDIGETKQTRERMEARTGYI